MQISFKISWLISSLVKMSAHVKDIIINPDGININIYKQGMNSLNNEING